MKEGGSERGREGRAPLRVEIETEVQNSTRFSPTDRSPACSPTCVAETRFGGKSAPSRKRRAASRTALLLLPVLPPPPLLQRTRI